MLSYESSVNHNLFAQWWWLLTDQHGSCFSLELVQFNCSVVSDSATPWIVARQASLSITNSRSLLKLMSIESVIPSNQLILCRPLLLPPSIIPNITVFSWLKLYFIICMYEYTYVCVYVFQFSSVAQSCLTLCDPMDCSTPGFPSINNFRGLLTLMSIRSVMPSNHLILCHPLFLTPSINPQITIF